jgi:hypothetical protein
VSPQLQRWNPAVPKQQQQQQQQRALAEAVTAREAAEAKLLTAEQRSTELAVELATAAAMLPDARSTDHGK